MPDWLTNPKSLIVLLCLGTLILGFNASLISLLLGNKAVGRDAPSLSQVLRGGSERQRQQAAQLDELHRIVSDFKSDGPSQDKSDD
jgi:hypothetical protein